MRAAVDEEGGRIVAEAADQAFYAPEIVVTLVDVAAKRDVAAMIALRLVAAAVVIAVAGRDERRALALDLVARLHDEQAGERRGLIILAGLDMRVVLAREDHDGKGVPFRAEPLEVVRRGAHSAASC